MNKFCIYRHIRLDTNKVFYIGIGDLKRPYHKHQRNNYWNNIITKTDYEIQILKSNLNWEDAKELEQILISFYGRKDLKTGILVNMTDGGDGINNYKHTEKSKLKMSISKLGKKQKRESIEKMIKNRYRKVINIKTGEIFNNIQEVAELLKINQRTLRSRLIGYCKNKTDYKFLDLHEKENE